MPLELVISYHDPPLLSRRPNISYWASVLSPYLRVKLAVWTWRPNTYVASLLWCQAFVGFRYVSPVNWSPVYSCLPAGCLPAFLSIAQPRICHCALILEAQIFMEISLRFYLSLMQASLLWYLSLTRGSVRLSHSSFLLSTIPVFLGHTGSRVDKIKEIGMFWWQVIGTNPEKQLNYKINKWRFSFEGRENTKAETMPSSAVWESIWIWKLFT